MTDQQLADRFEAWMCYESDHDELMDAVLFELQIQIRVGKATGTPMLHGDNGYARKSISRPRPRDSAAR